jgi:hypothetical protein
MSSVISAKVPTYKLSDGNCYTAKDLAKITGVSIGHMLARLHQTRDIDFIAKPHHFNKTERYTLPCSTHGSILEISKTLNITLKEAFVLIEETLKIKITYKKYISRRNNKHTLSNGQTYTVNELSKISGGIKPHIIRSRLIRTNVLEDIIRPSCRDRTCTLSNGVTAKLTEIIPEGFSKQTFLYRYEMTNVPELLFSSMPIGLSKVIVQIERNFIRYYDLSIKHSELKTLYTPDDYSVKELELFIKGAKYRLPNGLICSVKCISIQANLDSRTVKERILLGVPISELSKPINAVLWKLSDGKALTIQQIADKTKLEKKVIRKRLETCPILNGGVDIELLSAKRTPLRKANRFIPDDSTRGAVLAGSAKLNISYNESLEMISLLSYFKWSPENVSFLSNTIKSESQPN